MRDTVIVALANGGSLEDAVAKARPEMAKLLRTNLARASDPALLAYQTIYIEQIERLEKLDPHRCYLLGVWGEDIQADETNDLMMKRVTATADVLKSAREAPVSSYDRERAELLLAHAFSAAKARGGDFTRLSERGLAADEEERLCHSVVLLHRVIADQPAPDSALVFRHTLSP